MRNFHFEFKASIPLIPMFSWHSGWCIATITQHLYCKYLGSYQRVRIWEQFLQLESQLELELCQNLRLVAVTAAVKGLHFSFNLSLLFFLALFFFQVFLFSFPEQLSKSYLVTESLSQSPFWWFCLARVQYCPGTWTARKAKITKKTTLTITFQNYMCW